MSEKHVYVCDNCGAEAGDISDKFQKHSLEMLPSGWFAVAGVSDIVRPAHFCSNDCVATHFTNRAVPV